jgi:hypothetical protein
MVVIGREMASTAKGKTIARNVRLEFTVKSTTTRVIEHYSGAPGNRVRTEAPVVDVVLAGTSGDIEIRGMTPKEAKAFRVGAECVIAIHG